MRFVPKELKLWWNSELKKAFDYSMPNNERVNDWASEWVSEGQTRSLQGIEILE